METVIVTVLTLRPGRVEGKLRTLLSRGLHSDRSLRAQDGISKINRVLLLNFKHEGSNNMDLGLDGAGLI